MDRPGHGGAGILWEVGRAGGLSITTGNHAARLSASSSCNARSAPTLLPPSCQVKGYKRCLFCQEVRDDVEGALGGGAWADLLPRMCEGRLVPTPWLNKASTLGGAEQGCPGRATQVCEKALQRAAAHHVSSPAAAQGRLQPDASTPLPTPSCLCPGLAGCRLPAPQSSKVQVLPSPTITQPCTHFPSLSLSVGPHAFHSIPTRPPPQDFREPLYLTDKPVVLQDTRTDEEKRYPELFRCGRVWAKLRYWRGEGLPCRSGAGMWVARACRQDGAEGAGC